MRGRACSRFGLGGSRGRREGPRRRDMRWPGQSSRSPGAVAVTRDADAPTRDASRERPTLRAAAPRDAKGKREGRGGRPPVLGTVGLGPRWAPGVCSGGLRLLGCDVAFLPGAADRADSVLEVVAERRALVGARVGGAAAVVAGRGLGSLLGAGGVTVGDVAREAVAGRGHGPVLGSSRTRRRCVPRGRPRCTWRGSAAAQALHAWPAAGIVSPFSIT